MQYLRTLEELLPSAGAHIRYALLDNKEDKDLWISTRRVLNLVKPLYLEAQDIFLKYGEDAANRYKSEVVTVLSREAKSMNRCINDDALVSTIEHYRKYPDEDHLSLIFTKGDINTNECVLRLNRMYFFLQRIFERHTGDTDQGSKFQDLFTSDSSFTLCLDLLKELEVIDDKGKCILTDRNSHKLLAAIDAMKYQTKHQFFKKQLSDMALLNAFNSYLGTSIVKFKKDSKGFKSTRIEARKFISR